MAIKMGKSYLVNTNAYRDPRMIAMIKKYGGNGSTLYWMIVGLLVESKTSRLLEKYNCAIFDLAGDNNIEIDTQKFITDCISEFKLFKSDGLFFWSDKKDQKIFIKNSSKNNGKNHQSRP